MKRLAAAALVTLGLLAPGVAFAGEADALAVVDAGRNLDLEIALLALSSRTAAIGARLAHDRPRTGALGTRLRADELPEA